MKRQTIKKASAGTRGASHHYKYAFNLHMSTCVLSGHLENWKCVNGRILCRFTTDGYIAKKRIDVHYLHSAKGISKKVNNCTWAWEFPCLSHVFCPVNT